MKSLLPGWNVRPFGECFATAAVSQFIIICCLRRGLMTKLGNFLRRGQICGVGTTNSQNYQSLKGPLAPASGRALEGVLDTSFFTPFFTWDLL